MAKKMNKIEKLITELCPEGVEWKELSEVIEILDSQRKPVSKSNRNNGKYPYYGANGIQDYVDDYIFDGTFILLGEDGSVINKDGSPVLNWATGKIWVNNHAHILAEKSEIALLRYVFFALSVIDVTKVVKGNIPKITQQNLRNFQIPIPPLAIQQEIVKILDTFTTLEAELEAELEARKKQYEYYRDELLTFGDDVVLSTLSDVAHFMNGKGHEKHIDENGRYIVVNSKFVSTEGRVKKYSVKQISPVSANDILMVMSDLPNGKALAKCFYVDENDKYTLNQRICALNVKNNKELNAKFLFYILNRNKQLLLYDSGADQTNLRKDDILNIQIPIPPLAEQERIVAILDKFDALVNDISAGLPAELNARRKQYEYYRGKLLTFEPLDKEYAKQ